MYCLARLKEEMSDSKLKNQLKENAKLLPGDIVKGISGLEVYIYMYNGGGNTNICMSSRCQTKFIGPWIMKVCCENND